MLSWPAPTSPLSLWERVGVRVPVQAALCVRPHPAFGHPLPEGEGVDFVLFLFAVPSRF